MAHGYESFLAGFAYGATTVVVGQPLDTIKTRMQAMEKHSSNLTMRGTAKHLYKTEGLRGFYRGGTALLLGGGLMRSAQFGVYAIAHKAMVDFQGGATKPEQRWLGVFDPQVIFAGVFGGISRGLVEGPFEYIKVRRQVLASWKFTEVFKGCGATVFRNSFLFSFFMLYVDLQKQIIGNGGLSPFWKGAICANLAWATVWPLDVVKSQLQSGNYAGKSYKMLLVDIWTTGKLFKGIVPGLARSFIANGISMMVYNEVETRLLDLKTQS